MVHSNPLLAAAAARRKKIAELKTEILGDPIDFSAASTKPLDRKATSTTPYDRKLKGERYDDRWKGPSDGARKGAAGAQDHPYERDDDDRMMQESDEDDTRSLGHGYGQGKRTHVKRGPEGAVAREERAAVAHYLSLLQGLTVEQIAASLLKKAGEEQRLAAARKTTDAADITELAPKKANTDLKRDLAQRSAVLEKKTVDAMNELIRRRLQKQNLDAGGPAARKGDDGEGDVDLARAVDSLYEATRHRPWRRRGEPGGGGGPMPSRASEWDD